MKQTKNTRETVMSKANSQKKIQDSPMSRWQDTSQTLPLVEQIADDMSSKVVKDMLAPSKTLNKRSRKQNSIILDDLELASNQLSGLYDNNSNQQRQNNNKMNNNQIIMGAVNVQNQAIMYIPVSQVQQTLQNTNNKVSSTNAGFFGGQLRVDDINTESSQQDKVSDTDQYRIGAISGADDTIQGRKAYADIAHQTMTDYDMVNKQLKVKREMQATMDNTGSMQVTDPATMTQRAGNLGGLKAMLYTNLNKVPESPLKKKHINFDTKNQSHIAFQQSNSTMDDLRITSNMATKMGGEKDKQNRFNSKSALGNTTVDTKKIASNSTFSQLMATGLQQDSNQRLIQGQSGDQLQLPVLNSDPTTKQEVMSTVDLHKKHGDSLTQEKTLKLIANMQSQSPLSLTRLDFANSTTSRFGMTNTKQNKSEVEEIREAVSLSSTMPPLKNIMIAESLNSSAQQNKRKTTTTPGQNWGNNQESQLKVNDYLQQVKMLDPSFQQSFKKVNRGLEMHQRNLHNLSEMKHPARGLEQSNESMVADISNKLFGVSKPTNSVQASTTTFNHRSRSVLSPTALSAYTPVKGQQSPSAAIQASVIQKKRYSSLAQNKMKQPSTKVKKMGYIDTASIDEKTQQPKYSPRINFPGPNINVGPNKEVEMKKIKSQFLGSNRFEKGNKAVNLSAQVIEQWIDAVLKEDSDDENGEETQGSSDLYKSLSKAKSVTANQNDAIEFPGIAKVQKIKESQAASVKYGLDYQSLLRSGLTNDQALHLQRALYVHSIGFYETIQDCMSTAKNKKDIFVSVMRVYQQLLEKCHKSEWKMLINEVADTYENDIKTQKNEQLQQLKNKEMAIHRLKLDLLEQENEMKKIKQQVYKEKEAFLRLNESYLILQSHNEEGLKLRIKTEARLKELYRLDRQHREVFRQTRIDRENHRQEASENQQKHQDLADENQTLKDYLHEKDGINDLVKQAMKAAKRTTQALQYKLQTVEGPMYQLTHTANFNRKQAQKFEVQNIEYKMKVDALSSQLTPLQNQVQLLENENVGLKDLNKLLSDNEGSMRIKMTETLDELKEKADIFHGAKDAIEKKEQERLKMQSKLRTNTNLMYAFQTEKNKLELRMYEAKDKIAELEYVSDRKGEQLAFMNNHEHDRERSWLAEIDKNAEMIQLLQIADQNLFRAETTKVFGLQKTIEDQDLRIELLADDNKCKRDDLLLYKKLQQEKEKSKNDQIILLKDRKRQLEREMTAAVRSENQIRLQNVELITKQGTFIGELENQKAARRQSDRRVDENKKILNKLHEDINNYKITVQMYENTLARKRAKQKAKDKAMKEHEKVILHDLNKAEFYQNLALDNNAMIGEDFRSQALNNYHKILELQELLLFNSVGPHMWMERFLKLKTKYRREGEAFLMQLEDERLEQERLYKVIAAKDKEIEDLNQRHIDDQFLVQVIHQKLGYEFRVAHIGTQPDLVMLTKKIGTKYSNNHVAIQAHGFNLVDQKEQTEANIGLKAAQELNDDLDLLSMPQKRILKKKKVLKSPKKSTGGASSSNGSVDKKVRQRRRSMAVSNSPRKGGQSPGQSSISSQSSSPGLKVRKNSEKTFDLSSPLPTIHQKVKKSKKVLKKPQPVLPQPPHLLKKGLEKIGMKLSNTMTGFNKGKHQKSKNSFEDGDQDSSLNRMATLKEEKTRSLHNVNNSHDADIRDSYNNINKTKAKLRQVKEDDSENGSSNQDLSQISDNNVMQKSPHRSKKVLENSARKQEQSPPTTAVRQGVYSALLGATVQSNLPVKEERQEQLKNNKNIKGLIRSAATRD